MIFTDQKVIYVCDRKACNGTCPNPDCYHTLDIKHAVNFETKIVGNTMYFVEMEEGE